MLGAVLAGDASHEDGVPVLVEVGTARSDMINRTSTVAGKTSVLSL